MLKKAGIVVATAMAGLLAVSPLAFAGDKGGSGHGPVNVVDQENEQESAQGNGILNGNNILTGNSIQVCDTSVSAVVGVLVSVLAPATQNANTEQGRGDCTSAGGETVGQTTEQKAKNDNG